MQLVAVSVDSIPVGQPLPFPLMDKDGTLLAKKAFVIASRDEITDIAQRNGGLYIDVSDSETHHRAYVEHLHTMVRSDARLGQIADAKLSDETRTDRVAVEERLDWLDLQENGHTLLRDIQSPLFKERFERFHQQLQRLARSNPDGSLFALIYLAATDPRKYSATHAMLVSVMCGLAAREVLKWPAELETAVCKAALTMNVSMTDMQDRLALQLEAPTALQREAIRTHADVSAELLEAVGISDPLWLQAVRDHHQQKPGSLASRTPAERLARLIQRADSFAAKLSPRASRKSTPPAAAMQACYFDEIKQIDEAGAALIKAVGIYQPGSFVRLASNEVGIVVRRGINTTTPKVAVLINRSGMPMAEPAVRDTSQKEFRVTASVLHREVKVQINLERLLPLTGNAASDRPW
jgi:HD-GYP domain-containing protein (c-di-GMP phosphodiesterase class II)